MTLKERIALHRRMAEGYHDAYANHLERGGVRFPPEWRFADEATYGSTYFGSWAGAPIGKMVNRPGTDISEGANRELRVYLAAIPDYRAVEFMGFPSPEGFATRTLFEGRTKAGLAVRSWTLDFFLTNEAGLITRWETFVDSAEFGPIVEAAVGVRGPFESFEAYWRILGARLRELDAAQSMIQRSGGSA
jgi:hypothetical protein